MNIYKVTYDLSNMVDEDEDTFISSRKEIVITASNEEKAKTAVRLLDIGNIRNIEVSLLVENA